jgi:hypothetical protein
MPNATKIDHAHFRGRSALADAAEGAAMAPRDHHDFIYGARTSFSANRPPVGAPRWCRDYDEPIIVKKERMS